MLCLLTPKRPLQISFPYHWILASGASACGSQDVLWPVAGTHMPSIVQGQGVVVDTQLACPCYNHIAELNSEFFDFVMPL